MGRRSTKEVDDGEQHGNDRSAAGQGVEEDDGGGPLGIDGRDHRGSQRELHLEQVRLDELAERVVERAESRFPSLAFTLDAEVTTVWADAEELERAV